MEYELIRSRRRTFSIEVRAGKVLVRAPLRASRIAVERFVASRSGWIEGQLARYRASCEALPGLAPLTREDLAALTERARAVIPARVAYYAPLVGVTYNRVTIRCQKTRWGSCSSKGNLNFNCLLLLAPPEVLDSVVVHELCHRLVMDHSPRFYAQVRRVFPEYDLRNDWLRRNGQALFGLLPPD